MPPYIFGKRITEKYLSLLRWHTYSSFFAPFTIYAENTNSMTFALSEIWFFYLIVAFTFSVLFYLLIILFILITVFLYSATIFL